METVRMLSPENAAEAPPEISVVMSVYNGGAYLAEAIESILGQTFADFEFIIVNDGSSDNTGDILKEYSLKDSRIKIISHENQGLTRSLNNAVDLARGRFIARQDADDVSYPDRLEKQIHRMKADSGLLLLGACSDDVHNDGLKTRWGFHDDSKIRSVVFVKTPFPHSTAMMRADACKSLGGYDESFRTAQDMEFWMRFAKAGRIAMLDDALILRRVEKNSISVSRRKRQFYDALRARLKHGGNPALALYHSIRGLLIAYMPPALIQTMKCRSS